MFNKDKIKKIFEQITPILITPTATSITVSLSKRFLLFEALSKITNKIEDNPFLNFISLSRFEKKIEPFLSGTIKKFYEERKTSEFKKFFRHLEIYNMVRDDLEFVYNINPNVNITIFENGIIIYNNYEQNKFNILLLTIHSGSYIPPRIRNKISLSDNKRKREEDLDSNRLYCKLVLKQGGIWIDNKNSRFYCDLNRSLTHCIYNNKKFDQVKKVWKTELSKKEKKVIENFYKSFYLTLHKLLETHKFNIIFDGHSMKNLEGRPDISFGTHYIPKFYLPIVKSMKFKIISMGYDKVGINNPYKGGFILNWLSKQFPSLFIFSMEVNKKLYMTKNYQTSVIKRRNKVSNDLAYIFDIVEEEGYRMPISQMNSIFR